MMNRKTLYILWGTAFIGFFWHSHLTTLPYYSYWRFLAIVMNCGVIGGFVGYIKELEDSLKKH